MKQRKPTFIFISVIKALFLRELDTRISAGRTGLFWTFFEPFFQIFVFVAIHAAIREYGGGQSSFNYVVFMASGFIPFNMFRAILNSSIGAFQANKGLFSYKQVKPIDTIIARALVELFLSVIIVMMFLAIGLFFHVGDVLPNNIPMVFLGYIWLWIFSVAFAILIAVGNTFFISVGKTVSISTFGLLLFSAVFYPLISLPPTVQDVLLYNPLTHFMEMIHGFYLEALDDRFVNYYYMLLWTILPLFMGLWFYRMLERRIVSE